jgi:ferredoxin-NAD(P)+ reductase (naphthalene dioxygenase ferredoxin-specific)
MTLIHISDWQQPIDAGRHRILEAALDAGVPFPHGCGAGECGSCKCELLEGEVRSDGYSPDALTDEESANGLILACRARPVGDIRIRWLAAATAAVTVAARVFSIDRVAHDVVVLTLSLPHGKTLDFRPGQFAKLRFGKLPARSYSMASRPREEHLMFHIRVLPQGRVSQHVATKLKPGDSVEVQAPFGDAYWAGPAKGPLLLLAGGTGLAPMLSVLAAALSDGQASNLIHLYHGVRTEADMYAGDLLRRHSQEHKFRFVPVYSQATDPQSRQAHLHEAVAEDFDALDDANIYVSGPPPMVEAVKTLAMRRGAAADRVRADAFFAAPPEKKSLWERITGAIALPIALPPEPAGAAAAAPHQAVAGVACVGAAWVPAKLDARALDRAEP